MWGDVATKMQYLKMSREYVKEVCFSENTERAIRALLRVFTAEYSDTSWTRFGQKCQ